MSNQDETFFTSVGCMDGRVQDPISRFGKERFNALYADTITEAGLVGLLANNPNEEFLEGVKKKILISAQKHHSKGIIVHGHQECAGNPVDDETHKKDVLKSAEALSLIVPGLEVIPVFVIRKNGGWEALEL